VTIDATERLRGARERGVDGNGIADIGGDCNRRGPEGDRRLRRAVGIDVH
jgi:hypothetical protein